MTGMSASALGRLFFAALAFAFVAAAAVAQPISPDEAARLRAVVERGRLLFGLDRAAWVATDDVLAKVRDPAGDGYRGYTVERDGAGFTVTFHGGPQDRPVGMYVAKVEGGRIVSSRVLPAGERVALTPLQLRLAKAQTLSRSVSMRPCTKAPFNAVIVPPDAPAASLDVYLLSPQTETGTFPFGGHHLLKVGPNNEVISTRAFTNSCLNMPVPRGKKGVGAFPVVSHLLDPTPTEIHVFLSLSMNRPVVVVTGDSQRIWQVTGDSMVSTPLEDDPRRSKKRKP